MKGKYWKKKTLIIRFMKQGLLGKRLAQAAAVLCCLCLLPLFDHRPVAMDHVTPTQDTEGYYLLRTKEDFHWFIATAREKNPSVNARLMADIVLNDTRGWEEWDRNPPENSYAPIVHYSGHLDGNGHVLEGYYAVNGSWLAFLFTTLEEEARITNLTIRNSLFQTTYEDCAYEDDNGKTEVVTAAALCFVNYGVIENCEVQAKVTGAWDAGGIVGINYGQMLGCRFKGSVEAGADQSTKEPENPLASNALYAGGICRTNQGIIRDCVNEGTVTLDTLSDAFPIYDYAAGGIAGRMAQEAKIETSRNIGDVTSVQLAGGIAGASWGRIYECQNDGKVHIEQVERDYLEALVSAGICASNGGRVVNCLNTGAVTVNQKSLSLLAPVYGVACNTVNPDRGTIENSYYVKENVSQEYRQSGVNKLTLADEADFPAYLSREKRREDRDDIAFADFYYEEYADEEIRLGFGPEEDVTYTVQPGDSLWLITKKFYGDGRLIGNIVTENPELQNTVLLPGQEILVRHIDFSTYRRRDEEGFGLSYCRLPSGESCPTRYVLSKPIDWYYGYMRFAGSAGLDTLWPKTQKGLNQFSHQADEIHIFCRVDVNPEGDFLNGSWEEARERITKSAAANCGKSAACFGFQRFSMDNDEGLYSYSFLLFKKDERLLCTVAYRLCDNMLAEFIGVEPLEAYESVLCDELRNHEVMNRVRYQAAVVDTRLKIEEAQHDTETFYGRENWPFPQLHNPFALAQAYDKDAECIPYMLFSGAQ